MLKQHTPKQDAIRGEINELTAKFLATGGQVQVVNGFVERKNKVCVDYSFRAASNFTNTRPSNQNPNWANSRSTHELMTQHKIFQMDLAAMVGIKPYLLASYLHKRNNPPAELATKIENALAEMIWQKAVIRE